MLNFFGIQFDTDLGKMIEMNYNNILHVYR